MTLRSTRRPGTFVPMMAVCATALFSFVALAVDLGMLTVARTECQNAADAAALAGARQLNNKPGVSDNNRATAEATARSVVTDNELLNANFTSAQVTAADAKAYAYNPSTQAFTVENSRSANGPSWSAMRVEIAVEQPTYFANVMGISSMNNGAVAVAVHRPRDIALVLDFSASMRFGSEFAWETGYSGAGGSVYGLLSPDANYPAYGHYQRYTAYNTNATPNDSSANPAAVGSRANPLCCRNQFSSDFGEIYAPSNVTVETPGGPPVVFDFRFDPANVDDPTDPVELSSANTADLWNAFHRWFKTTPTDNPDTSLSPVDQANVFKYAGMNPPITSTTEVNRPDGLGGLSYVARTFNWSGYDPMDRTNTNGPVPAPDFFATQADDAATGVAYAGDRAARKNGAVVTDGSNWSPTATTGPAVNAAELLGWDSQGRWNSNPTYSYTGTGFSGTPPDRRDATSGWSPGTANPASGSQYNNDWRDFRDATWERYGYDLDVAHYVANRPRSWDPRWDINLSAGNNATGTALWYHIPPRLNNSATGAEQWPSGNARKKDLAFIPQLLPAAQRYQGYSMGPGYWGKTFYAWPADPRPEVDWRRKFFRKSDGTALDPAVDNIDSVLFTNGTGSTLKTSGYAVDYDAVLDWLRAGPQTLPPNLRAGRILYYSSIPDGITAEAVYANNRTGLTQFQAATGNLLATAADRDEYNADANSRNKDRNFWKAYIDFVVGLRSPTQNLAGVENRGWPEGATPKANGGIDGFAHGIAAAPSAQDPRPYSNYTTNPSRPRLHLWFGPMSMVNFLTARADRRYWWPGTAHEAQCWQLKAAVNSALQDIRINHPNDYCGMAYFNASLNSPRVDVGQNWADLKNSLFYPYNMLSLLRDGDTTTEQWAHTNGGANNRDLPGGHVPISNGGTDPQSGMAMGYNLLMAGRKGAAKILVFETDGAPNNTRGWTLSGSGTNTRYSNSGSTTEYPVPGLTDSLFANGLSTSIPRTGIDVTATPTSVNMTLGVVQQIVAPYSESGSAGLSLPNTPARVYGIGFGDLFEGYDGTNDWESRSSPTTIDGVTYSASSNGGGNAVFFLRRVGQVGNTLAAQGDQPIPKDLIITGRYQQRIERLRTTLERIMQSGVQVTLIE